MPIKLFNIHSDPNLQLIDTQHREYLDLIDAFTLLPIDDIGISRILETMSFIENHAETHLQTEEGIMDLIAYPEKDYHISEHNCLRENLALIPATYYTHGKSSCLDMLKYLKKWIISHIGHTDSRLINYYLEYYKK